ncbi:microtubule-associated protein RP/EB family member protein, putative [Babesia bigemina]|uniref:Microtubule-associated protein RP/EB family member protein, putative n=1 Tax=Babesia bigemina TaxID=5866 RepID=A0A061DBT5_BABBI|nr:microtubule-associated protein RP/EB family member protein, putative [Babesia bigemina]CDR96334.1 microtubule-associated protein RP/EB family member protein, putative [Babesia bigemina]|eukprot:XP_012768520.1 microtubule-associated protein RP/EB family member protein, putative [Babesia bigemina]
MMQRSRGSAAASPHRGLDVNPLVGRSELIAWVNDTLGVTIERVEQCCNGAVYIQLLDVVHPGRVPLARVKFGAALEYEYLANYKVLQIAFTKLGISKHVDVQKLTKGRYQDNLEFLQWMRGYVESHRTVESSEYDGVRRRVTAVIRNCIANNSNAHLTLGSVTSALPAWAQEGVTVPLIKECLANVKASATTNSQDGAKPSESRENNVSNRQGSVDPKQVVRATRSAASSISGRDAKIRRITSSNGSKSQQSDASSRTSTADTHVKESDAGAAVSRCASVETSLPPNHTDLLDAERHRCQELESQLKSQKQQAEDLRSSLDERDRTVAALQEQVDSLKKQLGQLQADKQVAKMSKDFYYNKLRRIEILCQKCETGQIEVAPLFDVMYATDNVA